MSNLSSLRVYATQPHECSYLEDREATTLFIDPQIEIDQSTYSQLSTMGFRRSGNHVYKPICRDCQACLSARIDVANFKPSDSQRKILRKNKDIKVKLKEKLDISSDYPLYQLYINTRHRDGDMYPASVEQFEGFLNQTKPYSRFYCFYQSERLIAVALTDLLDDGLSAIYTFYDPELSRRSLGKLAILWQIDQARQLGLPYLYLGYWIKNCQKMRYKSQYRPLELLINGKWLLMR